MKKNSLIIFFSVIILILAGAFYLSKLKTNEEQVTASKEEEVITSKEWSVIYLTSGEIYVARLDYPVNLSELHFASEAYMLQAVKGQNETGEAEANVQLTPLEEFLWAPKDLYVNRDQIVFYGPVREESGVGKAIIEAGKWGDEVVAEESQD